MTESRATHRFLSAYMWGVYISALMFLLLSWLKAPPVWSWALVLLLIGVVVSENFSLAFPSGASISIAFPLTIAAIALLGPTSAAVVAAGDSLSLAEIRSKKPVGRILFNTSSVVLVTLAAGWTYVTAGGAPMARVTAAGAVSFEPFTAEAFAAQIVPMLAAAAVSAFGNVILVSLAMSLSTGTSLRHVLRQLAWVLRNEFALALVGFAIAQVLAISALGLLLFVAPLVVSRQVYQRYIELRHAYADTVRSLVGVLEAKDPYTRGHSERVAAYATSMGRKFGLADSDLERLEWAALLHDVGKIAVSRAILVKPGRLSEAEYWAIRSHPERGAAFIERVPSLRDAVPLVRYHHEWYGGGGYCAGIAGDDIPELARLLSVADAYDAMTTARPYRPARSPAEALAELIAGAGSQFDPAMVRLFAESGVASPDALTLGSGDDTVIAEPANV